MVNRVLIWLIANLGHKSTTGNDVQKMRPDIFYLFYLSKIKKLGTAKIKIKKGKM